MTSEMDSESKHPSESWVSDQEWGGVLKEGLITTNSIPRTVRQWEALMPPRFSL